MPVGKHAAINAKQLKAKKRKKRLSTFGLENFDVEEIIINQQKKGKRDNRGSEDHSEDHQFVHEATADEPPEMSFVTKNTGFLASLSSTDKTVNLVCNGISTEHPSGKYWPRAILRGTRLSSSSMSTRATRAVPSTSFSTCPPRRSTTA